MTTEEQAFLELYDAALCAKAVIYRLQLAATVDSPMYKKLENVTAKYADYRTELLNRERSRRATEETRV